MEENYIEWLVKRKDPVYAWPVKILMIVVCALSVLAALQMLLGILILAAAAAATYFVCRWRFQCRQYSWKSKKKENV